MTNSHDGSYAYYTFICSPNGFVHVSSYTRELVPVYATKAESGGLTPPAVMIMERKDMITGIKTTSQLLGCKDLRLTSEGRPSSEQQHQRFYQNLIPKTRIYSGIMVRCQPRRFFWNSTKFNNDLRRFSYLPVYITSSILPGPDHEHIHRRRHDSMSDSSKEREKRGRVKCNLALCIHLGNKFIEPIKLAQCGVS